MSVIVSRAEEMKALMMSAALLFPVRAGAPVEPRVFERLHIANHRAYWISYFHRDLTPEEEAGFCAQYAQAQPTPDVYGPAELLEKLHSLQYNCISNGGTYTVEGDDEEARRRLVVSVAFEAMVPGGAFVQLADFGHMRRPDLERYEITTRNHSEGVRGRVYLLDGMPHPFEGFITTDPVQAFRRLWEMHDACAAHAQADYERALEAQARKLGVM